MKLIVALLMMTVTIGGGWAVADTIAKEYKPSEVQLLRLKVKHKDAELAQLRFQQAQQAFQASITDLQEEAEKVKEENKWEAGVQFNADNLSFNLPTPPIPAPKPADKKDK